PPRQAAGPGRGVGLVNSRLRLAQAFGERALLILENAPAGGCVARLRLPVATHTTTAEERHR
ncbi:MAG TPA: hypothetical protein VJN44_12890, partial [Roseateles sp.]|nr:hypothetical protein [Roseateles sp.]